MRIDKFLSNAGIAGRKDAAVMIKRGRISVGGKTVTDPSADTLGRAVCMDGAEVISGENIVLAMDKPSGYLSATEDKRDKTVMELLPPPFCNMSLVIVGRLDKDTEGLLLFTTDGQFAHVVTSPKTKLEKEYYLTTDIPFVADDAERIASGVSIGEGETVSGKLNILSPCEATLTITEGKFHEVKRMLFAVGKTVTYLRRDRIGKLSLSALQLGRGEIVVVKKEQIL